MNATDEHVEFGFLAYCFRVCVFYVCVCFMCMCVCRRVCSCGLGGTLTGKAQECPGTIYIQHNLISSGPDY